MSVSAGTAFVDVRGDFTHFNRDVDQTVSNTKGKFGGLGKAAAAGLAVGLGGAVVAMKGFANAAIESEKSQARMVTQLKASGISFKAHSKQIDDVIQKVSKLSGLDDEDLQDSFTNIVRVTGDVNKSLKLTGLAADFARAKHLDVAKAGEIVAKVAGGNTGILARYGIQIEKGATSTEALGKLQQKFAGQAEAYGKTTAGAQDRFRVAVENLQEKLGQKLLPIVAKVADGLTKMITAAENGTGVFKVVGNAIDRIKSLFSGGGDSGALASSLGDVKSSLAGIIDIGRKLWDVFGDNFLAILKNALKTMRDVFQGVAKAFGGVVDLIAGVLTGDWGRAWDGIKNIFGGVWDAMTALLKGAITQWKELVKAALEAIGGVIKGAAGLIKDAAKAAFNGVVDGIKALASAYASAGKWIVDQHIAAIKAAVAAVKEVGGWIVNRIVDGLKATTAAIATVGGWIKNRISDSLTAAVDTVKSVGGWVINRIIDGLKEATAAISTVGGWIRNRIMDGLNLAVDSIKGLGGWVINRVVDGLKASVDAIGSVGGWIRNRISDGLNAAKDGFLGLGGSVIGWIVKGLKDGANSIIKFLNSIIHKIEGLPFVPNIPDIPQFAAGGKLDKDLPGFARGGVMHHNKFARGGAITRPMVVVGEEAPKHPEYVIPTNPAYRGRAMDLFGQLGRNLGIPGFANGGVIAAFHRALNKTNANPKPSLALFEAGIVESGLENLPYGDRDSRGALQIRDSTARPMGVNNMDPYDSALAFLTRGFWGKGSAISLAANHPSTSAGWVAQQVQGSAYPDRYDQVSAQAKAYLAGVGITGSGTAGTTGGGIMGAIGSIASSVSNLIGNVLDVMPSTKGIASWINPKWFWDKAVDWVKEKAKGFLSDGLGNGTSGNIQDAIKLAMSLGFAHPSGGQLTGGSHVAGSYHYQGRAADFGAAGHSVGEMKGLFNAFAWKYGKNILEMFYDPVGWYVKNGGRVNGAIGGHVDHLHLALARGGALTRDGVVQGPYVGSYKLGGTVPRDGLAYVHQGETITPVGGDGVTVEVQFHDPTLKDLIDVRVRERDRVKAAQYLAGTRR